MGLFSKTKDAMAQAQSMGVSASGMMSAGMPSAAEAGAGQLAQKLNASGVEAPGVLLEIRPSGTTSFGGGQMCEFDVRITPAGGEPYVTAINQSMLPAQLEGIQVGANVTVKYDPDQPAAALLYGW